MSASAGPIGAECRIGKVDAGIGQADVIDDGDNLAGGNVLADGGVDVIAQGRGFLNARAGARPHVNLELAGVDDGKEILPRQGARTATDPTATNMKTMRKTAA